MNAALAFAPIMNVNPGPVRRNTNLAIVTRNVALVFVPEMVSASHGGKQPSTKCYDEDIHS